MKESMFRYEVGRQLGISRERVRQIQATARKKLEKAREENRLEELVFMDE